MINQYFIILLSSQHQSKAIFNKKHHYYHNSLKNKQNYDEWVFTNCMIASSVLSPSKSTAALFLAG